MINENKNESPEPESSQTDKAKEESVQEVAPEKKKRGKKVFARNPMPTHTP